MSEMKTDMRPLKKIKPENVTILIVDDDASICSFLESLFTYDGFEVVVETRGDRALELLKQNSYLHVDLVILDLMLPGKGGYSIIREIQGEGYKNTPCFVITARELDPDAMDMIQNESNVVEVWKKPIYPKQFQKKVH